MKTFKKTFKKTLLVALAAIATFSLSNGTFAATATSANDSWTRILADSYLLVNTPYTGTFGPAGIFNACATETEFRAISPVDVCVQYTYVPATNESNYPGTYECVKNEKKITSMPRSGTQHTCVRQDMSEAHYPDCLEWADVAYNLPAKMNIEVMYGSGEAYASTAFYKSFTVPACAN
ncbi:MAG: hypothetical protein ACJ763_06340 [Bdellovibrionia bacterium]